MAGFFQLLSVCILMFVAQVSGFSLSFSQNEIIIGTTGTFTMRCSVDEQNVAGVYNIEISRATSLNSPNTELLADIDLDESQTPTLNPDLNNDKGFVAGGTLDKGDTVLTLDMDKEKLTCSDAREYICIMNYAEIGFPGPRIVRENGTFSAFVYPSITTMQGKRNEEFIEGSLSSSPAPFEVGDQLYLTCAANIGSYEATLIRWRKTSEVGTQDDFIGYQPQEGTYTEGSPSLATGGCSYMRSATIIYNTTVADANRDNNLAFECYVSVSGGPYGQGYTTVNNPRFYVDVKHTESTTTSPNSTRSTTPTSVSSSTVDPLATTFYVKSSTGKLSPESSKFQYIYILLLCLCVYVQCKI